MDNEIRKKATYGVIKIPDFHRSKIFKAVVIVALHTFLVGLRYI